MSRQFAPSAVAQVLPEPPPAKPARCTFLALALLILSLGGSVAAALAGLGVVQEVAEETAPLEAIPHRIGSWRSPEEDQPIEESVREMLTFDRALRRTYHDPNGYSIEVWVLFWTTRNAIKGYHHPDICFPSRGWKRADSDAVPVTLADGGTFQLSTRRFELDGQKQLVAYWTQEGRRVWTPEDERAAQLAGDSHRWIGDRLTLRGKYESTAKLTVLMGADLWHESVEKKMTDFCRDFATELYRVCPWAAPEAPTQ
jgi:EpsI family protein